ncbi:MAG: cytochrome c553 [Lentisphaeria bacterium]
MISTSALRGFFVSAVSRCSCAFVLSAPVLFMSLHVSAGMIDKNGMKAWEICGLCHGADGNSYMSKFPKLAGQKPAYIKQQFLAFRNSERENDGGQMQAITTEVELSQLDDISEYFFTQAQPKPVEISAQESRQSLENLRIGKNVYERGREGVLACVGCHSDKDSTAPWLDAQHADYLKKQLRDFDSGKRKTEIEVHAEYGAKEFTGLPLGEAGKLTEGEIDSLSTYLASLRLTRQ